MKCVLKTRKNKIKNKKDEYMSGGNTAQDKIIKYRINIDELHDCFGKIDITQQIHQLEDLNRYIGEADNITFIPKITILSQRAYHKEFTMSISLIVEYIRSDNNKQIAEFKIMTDVPMTKKSKELFVVRHDNTDKLVFHPIHFLFFQGTNDLTHIQSCPSMGIHVEDEYVGTGFARNMIKLALIALQNITNNTILNDPENNFGGSLENQIISIDADASNGFWEYIGMYEDPRSGYDYAGKQKRRCIGMEKIISIVKMYNWAFSK